MNDEKVQKFNAAKTYEAPKLSLYGAMARLTASGMSGVNEVGNGPPQKKA